MKTNESIDLSLRAALDLVTNRVAMEKTLSASVEVGLIVKRASKSH